MTTTTNIIEEYETHFSPRAFAESFMSDDANYECKTKPEEFFHEMFHQKRIPGTSQLDVGSGATFRGVISSSAYFTEIYTSDLLTSARDEAKKWLRADEDALTFDWEFKCVARLEKHDNYKEIEERVRKAVKDVLPCNVLLENPLHPKKATFDVVTSSFCLDCLSNKKEYFVAMKNISSLINPGGHLCVVSGIESPGIAYTKGGHFFPAPNATVEDTHKAITDAGLKILQSKTYKYDESEHCTSLYNTGHGVLTILAKKN